MAAMGVVAGNYSLDASTAGEFDSVQRELENLTSTMYLVSQQRLDYSIGLAIPAMTTQLVADGNYASMYTAALPEYERATVGASNAAASTLANAINSMMASLGTSQRNAYLWAVERMMHAAAGHVSTAMGLTRAVAYEEYRKLRDDGLGYLFKDIELATKVRGVGDGMFGTAAAAMFASAKDAIGELAHKQTMAHIAWEQNRKVKSIDNKTRDYASFLGMAVQGIADGYSDSKAAAALAAKGG